MPSDAIRNAATSTAAGSGGARRSGDLERDITGQGRGTLPDRVEEAGHLVDRRVAATIHETTHFSYGGLDPRSRVSRIQRVALVRVCPD